MSHALAEALLRLLGVYLLVSGLIQLAQYLLVSDGDITFGGLLFPLVPVVAAKVLFSKSSGLAAVVTKAVSPYDPNASRRE